MWFLYNYNKFHRAKFLGIANEMTGRINTQYNKVEDYFVLREENRRVHRMNDSLLNLMFKNKKRLHFPYEIVFRILYLLWTIWSLYELFVYIKLWKKFKYPIHFNFNFVSYYQLFVGIIIPLSWLYIIPKITMFPISNIMNAQPDLAFCLIISVVTGILIVILKTIIKNRHRSSKFIVKHNS